MRGLKFEHQPWRADAACKGLTHLFFPAPGYNPDGDRAKAVCRSCPVIEPCADDALLHQRPGIQGGMTEDDRKTIRSQRHRDNQEAVGQ